VVLDRGAYTCADELNEATDGATVAALLLLVSLSGVRRH
jgi:hypothetical protein